MHVRKARFAGSWYTNDPVVLRNEIDEFSELVQKDIWKPLSGEKTEKEEQQGGPVKAGVLPHAGLYFSGRGIAHFFHYLGSNTHRIIIIAPSHYVPLPPDTLVSSVHDSFQTPLGGIPGADLLATDDQGILQRHDQAVEMEHAVEMFLPFVARVREVSKQPLEVGMVLLSEISSLEMLERRTNEFIHLAGKEELETGKTVLIASSDFTHYGPRFGHTPFGTGDVQTIEKNVEHRDLEVAEGLCSFQFEQLMKQKQHQDLTICGFSPGLLTASVMERLGARGNVVDYYTSNYFVGPDVGFVAYCTILWR